MGLTEYSVTRLLIYLFYCLVDQLTVFVNCRTQKSAVPTCWTVTVRQYAVCCGKLFDCTRSVACLVSI